MLLENQIAALGTLIHDAMQGGFDGLSPRAAAILLTLLNRGPLTISNIAEIVGVTQPTATRIVDGLERTAHVKRKARDGRNVAVALTARGNAMAKRLQKSRTDMAHRVAIALDTDERNVFAALIDKILFQATTGRRFARTTCRYCDHDACRGNACPVNRRATEIENTR